MLTFHKKEGEYIVLIVDGKNITIRLDKLKGHQAKISVGAPDKVEVLHGDLLEIALA